MSEKKAAKSKTARGVRILPAKALSGKQARGVKGGFTSVEHGAITKSAKTGTGGVLIVKMNDVIVSG